MMVIVIHNLSTVSRMVLMMLMVMVVVGIPSRAYERLPPDLPLLLCMLLHPRTAHIRRSHPAVVPSGAPNRVCLIPTQHRLGLPEWLLSSGTPPSRHAGGALGLGGGCSALHHCPDPASPLALIQRGEVVGVPAAAGVVEKTAGVEGEVVEVAEVGLVASASVH